MHFKAGGMFNFQTKCMLTIYLVKTNLIQNTLNLLNPKHLWVKHKHQKKYFLMFL